MYFINGTSYYIIIQGPCPSFLLSFSFLSVSILEPVFIQIKQIPDSSEKNDDKLYFFFREKSLDSGGTASPSVLARVGRVCLVRPFQKLKN